MSDMLLLQSNMNLLNESALQQSFALMLCSGGRNPANLTPVQNDENLSLTGCSAFRLD